MANLLFRGPSKEYYMFKKGEFHDKLLPAVCVYRGHKSICLVDFPDGMPQIVAEMPEADRFHEIRPEEFIYLCDDEEIAL